MIAGLTGGIGSGKSTVSGFFKELGVYVIDWDELSRQVVAPHRAAWRKIVAYFGEGILREDLTLDREKISGIVFADDKARAVLNGIVHPEVLRQDTCLTEERRKIDATGLIVKDIPLLIEADLMSRVDKLVVVYASYENRLRRLAERGVAEPEALRRIGAQMPLEEKVKVADYVVYNDGSLEETRQQVEKIYATLSGGK